MTFQLQGRLAIVTGAARGIGAAIAMGLAQQGADLVLVDRDDCNALARQIADAGGRAKAVVCDVTDPASIAETCEKALVLTRGGVILVNNAGGYPSTPLETLDLAQWRGVFALNVEAPMLFTLGLAPRMKIDRWGRIINIASSIFTIARKDVSAYTASKMAVIGLTRSLASDLGEHGVTVNAIAPGLTQTPGAQAMAQSAGRTDLFEELAQARPIRRVLFGEDTAGLACFLASEGASMITGQTILVDGGLSRV